MEVPFKRCNILIPKKNIDYNLWSVIACDQYTSQLEYWNKVKDLVGDKPSTYKITLPEVYLEDENVNERIENINKTMNEYLDNDIFDTLEDAMIRIKTVCAPANAIRLGMDTYCAKHGHCISQDLKGRNMMFPPAGACKAKMCSTAVVTGKQPEGRMIVIIVGEELGY